jgi:hypothetical protein
VKTNDIVFRDDLYPRFEANQVDVRIGFIAPDVCPEPLKQWPAGLIEEGVFIPNDSVSLHLFNLQREYDQQAKQGDKLTNVYFIQPINGGPVKIGRADNVEKRLSQLQMYSPIMLRIVGVYSNVPINIEEALHLKYQKYQLWGEWFDEIILQEEGI